MQQELREAFRLYDKEGNGYITTAVFRDILHELDDKLSPEELDLMIEEIDADGSGTLDFDGTFIICIYYMCIMVFLFFIYFICISSIISRYSSQISKIRKLLFKLTIETYFSSQLFLNKVKKIFQISLIKYNARPCVIKIDIIKC